MTATAIIQTPESIGQVVLYGSLSLHGNSPCAKREAGKNSDVITSKTITENGLVIVLFLSCMFMFDLYNFFKNLIFDFI